MNNSLFKTMKTASNQYVEAVKDFLTEIREINKTLDDYKIKTFVRKGALRASIVSGKTELFRTGERVSEFDEILIEIKSVLCYLKYMDMEKSA